MEGSTIYTDYILLTGFRNSNIHEDVFARWAKCHLLHIRIAQTPNTE